MDDAIIRNALASTAFDDFYHDSANSQIRFAMAYLTPDDCALFGCEKPLLWLSRLTLDEHKAKHPEISIADYRTTPDIIARGEVWTGHAHRRYLILHIAGKPYRAAIKSDAHGLEAWFLSLVISGKQKPAQRGGSSAVIKRIR